MKNSNSSQPSSLVCRVAILATAGLACSVSAQEVLFQETFEDDGSENRYYVEGGAVYELEDIRSDLSINLIGRR